MMRTIALLFVALVWLPRSGAGQEVEPWEPGLEISRIDLRNLPGIATYFRVRNISGGYVQGLGSGDIEVRLDDRNISSFQLRSRFRDGEYLSIVLVLDLSQSMRTSMEEVQAAVRDLVGRFGADDQVGLVRVDSQPRILVGPSTDREILGAVLEDLRARGGTALRDAVLLGIRELTPLDGARKFVVVFSDGYDTESTQPLEAILRAATAQGVQVVTLGVGEGRDDRTLTQLAGGTGGRFFTLQSLDDLRTLYQDLADFLESEYEVAFSVLEDEVGAPAEIAVSVPMLCEDPSFNCSDERRILLTTTPGTSRSALDRVRRRVFLRSLLFWGAISLAAFVGLFLFVSWAWPGGHSRGR